MVRLHFSSVRDDFILDNSVEETDNGTVAAGIQIGNTVTSSYIVDNYPLQSTSVITFYAVFLNLSAFINPVGQDGYTQDNFDNSLI